MTMTPANVLLQFTDSESFQYQLLANHDHINIGGFLYECRSTVLNVFYTYHAYHLVPLADGFDIIVLVADIVVVCYIPFEHAFVWSSNAHNFLVAAKSAIEAILVQVPSWTTGKVRPPHLLNLPSDTKPCLVSGTQRHLAHYLWNHLGSMWRMSKRPRLALSYNRVIIAPNSEKYGDITDLFPDLHLTRLNIPYDTRRPSFVDGTCVEPYSLGPIGLGLRESICRVNLLRQCSVLPPIQNSNICICLAFRKEIRKSTNRSEMINTIAAVAMEHYSKYHIQTKLYLYESILFPGDEPGVSSASFETEIQEIISMSDYINAFSSLDVIQNVPISKALESIAQASFYIAEWGASLTILSWILGLPGIWLCPEVIRSQVLSASLSVFSCTQDQTSVCSGNYFSEINSPAIQLPASYDYTSQSSKGISWHAHPSDYTIDCQSFEKSLRYFYERLI